VAGIDVITIEVRGSCRFDSNSNLPQDADPLAEGALFSRPPSKRRRQNPTLS
jgi:hypothetical protein